MKKVLIIYYSQSGQLKSVVDSFSSRIADDDIELDIKRVVPKIKYPYPWSFYNFFDEFPESVYLDGCDVNELEGLEDEYDLIVLGYTVWFLSPSIPMVGFLKSEQAKKLLKDKPVVTLIACRDMWVMAQESMKGLLDGLGARLIDNVVLSDQGKSIYTFFTTPRWLLTGKKDKFWFFPPAGISDGDIQNASRFGARINEALKQDKERGSKPLLQGLGAVSANGKLIGTEKIAIRSFRIWTKLIKAAGAKGSLGRKVVITVYAVFLVLLVLSVVPLNILIRKLISPMQKKRLKLQESYFEQPSGR
jgi:hypothetical protein